MSSLLSFCRRLTLYLKINQQIEIVMIATKSITKTIITILNHKSKSHESSDYTYWDSSSGAPAFYLGPYQLTLFGTSSF